MNQSDVFLQDRIRSVFLGIRKLFWPWYCFDRCQVTNRVLSPFLNSTGSSTWRQLSSHDRAVVFVLVNLVHLRVSGWRQQKENGQFPPRNRGTIPCKGTYPKMPKVSWSFWKLKLFEYTWNRTVFPCFLLITNWLFWDIPMLMSKLKTGLGAISDRSAPKSISA